MDNKLKLIVKKKGSNLNKTGTENSVSNIISCERMNKQTIIWKKTSTQPLKYIFS